MTNQIKIMFLDKYIKFIAEEDELWYRMTKAALNECFSVREVRDMLALVHSKKDALQVLEEAKTKL